MLREYIAEMGLDVIKDRVTNRFEQEVLRNRLLEFVEKQSKYNFNCSRAEEIDFEGLSKYICNYLIEDVRIRLFGNKGERSEARKSIISKAVIYSQAKTNLSKSRAIDLTSTALEILRKFYRKKVNRDLKFIATEIEDTVSDEMMTQHSAQTELITRTINNMGNRVTEEIKHIESSNLLSIDKNLSLIKSGDIRSAESNITTAFNALSSGHILFPDYGFGVKQIDGIIKLQSIPLSKEATSKYPPKISCTGFFKIGTRYIENPIEDIADYANRHQLTITIDIQDAKKLLGDIPDPVQEEAEYLIGKKIAIHPKPFPEAFPCSISLNGIVVFEYILLRTQEIMDDNTIIVSNQEQLDCPFKICLTLRPYEKKINFNIHIMNSSNTDMLRYDNFIKAASAGAILTIKALSINKIIAEGTLSHNDYQCGFETIDEEISFLEDVVTIEKYFGTVIHIPEEIAVEDIKSVFYLATLARDKKSTEPWSEAELSFDLTKDIKAKIAAMDDSLISLSYVAKSGICIFGVTYPLPIIRTFDKAQVKDLDKLKQKAEVLDVGDLIKIVLVPGEKAGACVDMIHNDDKN